MNSIKEYLISLFIFYKALLKLIRSHPVSCGAVLFVFYNAVLNYIFLIILGPFKCKDDWASSSIGMRGACSWHGGIDNSRNFWIFLLSCIAIWCHFQIGSKKHSLPNVTKVEISNLKKIESQNPYGDLEVYFQQLIKSGISEKLASEQVDRLKDLYSKKE